MKIITLGEPHETITMKSFLWPFKIHNILSVITISLLGIFMLKCADNQNSICFLGFFLFSLWLACIHGYKTQNAAHYKTQSNSIEWKCEWLQPSGLQIYLDCFLPRRLKKFSCFSRAELYVDCGFGVQLFSLANAEEISQTF